MKDPYVYENTNILINLADIKVQKDLDDYETTMAKLAIVDLLSNPINLKTTVDIFLIHKKLFQDVYAWAGEPRTINIYKEEAVLDGLSVTYSDYRYIKKDLDSIQKEIDFYDWKNKTKKEIVSKIAIVIAKIWQVHAFREGITRTICLFLYFFMKKYGLKVNIDFIGKHSKYFRNALVLASIGQYSEYEHLESILMDCISFKRITNEETKYQTIRGYELDKYEYNYHHIKDK